MFASSDQWMYASVADRTHQQIYLLVLFGKAPRGCLLGALDPILPTQQIFHLYILYMMSDILTMFKKLKSTIAVFVLGQLDPIFLCMLAIHAWRTNWKDYVMIFLSI